MLTAYLQFSAGLHQRQHLTALEQNHTALPRHSIACLLLPGQESRGEEQVVEGSIWASI